MSAARPVRGLVARGLVQSASIPTTSTRAHPLLLRQCRGLQTTAPNHRRGSRFRNVKAEELGLLGSRDKMDKFKAKHTPEYTDKELATLAEEYTPAQMNALRAGEAAVNPEDVLIQGRLRDDMFRPEYVDDYATVDPRVDLRPNLGGEPREPHWPTQNQFREEFIQNFTSLVSKKSGEQLTRAMVRALRKVKHGNGNEELIDLTEEELNEMEKDPSLAEKYMVPPDLSDAAIKKEDKKLMSAAKAMQIDELVDQAWKEELEYMAQNAKVEDLGVSTFDINLPGPDGEINMHTAEAYELDKVPGVAGLYNMTAAEEDPQDDQGEYQEIKQLTGMSIDEIKSIYTRIIVTRFVHNQTRLGKIRSIAVMAIAGNGNGRLGIGVGKSVQMDVASRTAQMLALRNMKPIRRYENRTIYGNISSKVGGTVVELAARPPGFGLRVPSRLFEMCRAAGIHDIAVHMPRSKNPMNTVKATYNALLNQHDPEEIAIGRGKKLVDARKVYYGGAVY